MPLRFLIADDSATNRMLFSATIARMGHQADVVATGKEAIDRIHSNRYDLVFLDVNMPGMDGATTAREIINRDLNHTPVYAISGYVSADKENTLTAAGVRACLIKPLDREKITRVLSECQIESEAQPQASKPASDVPRKLMGVYAQELRTRADACLRYLADQEQAALLREAHTLRALADMLKTTQVQQAATFLEDACTQPADASDADQQAYHLKNRVQSLCRECHRAASIIERLI
jgi:CheY-like chemotaxis protein